jgi:alpha-L-rhamnosidase
LLDMLERTDPPSYGYQIEKGATALTEAWDANPSSSQDHLMLGDAEEWFYRGLGGINVDLSLDGVDQLVLRPEDPGKIQWVHSHYRSALGLVESDWQRKGLETIYTFVIPANARATFELTSPSPQTVTLNGHRLSMAPGIISARIDSSHLQIVVGSGRYVVRATNTAQSIE